MVNPASYLFEILYETRIKGQGNSQQDAADVRYLPYQ
jgi:hypothetical protein